MIGFGKRLKRIREARHQTQKELAVVLETTDRSIQYYERETVTPNLEFIVKAAKKLKVSSDYLLGITDSFESNINHESTIADAAETNIKQIQMVIDKLPALDKYPNITVFADVYTLTHLGFTLKDINKSDADKYVSMLEKKLEKALSLNTFPHNDEAQYLLVQTQAILNSLSQKLSLPKVYLAAELTDDESTKLNVSFVDASRILSNAMALVRTAKDLEV